jgi:hypothetical protein
MEIDRTKPVVPYGCEQCPNKSSINCAVEIDQALVSRTDRTSQGRGYSYLIVFIISAFMGFQSIDLKFNKTDQWVFSTKEVPFTIVAPGLIFIAGVMGLDTSAIALGIGNVLTSGRKVE